MQIKAKLQYFLEKIISTSIFWYRCTVTGKLRKIKMQYPFCEGAQRREGWSPQLREDDFGNERRQSWIWLANQKLSLNNSVNKSVTADHKFCQTEMNFGQVCVFQSSKSAGSSLSSLQYLQGLHFPYILLQSVFVSSYKQARHPDHDVLRPWCHIFFFYIKCARQLTQKSIIVKTETDLTIIIY